MKAGATHLVFLFLGFLGGCTAAGHSRPPKASSAQSVSSRSFVNFDFWGINILRRSDYDDWQQLQTQIRTTLKQKLGLSDLEGFQGDVCFLIGPDTHEISWECTEMHGCEMKLLQVRIHRHCQDTDYHIERRDYGSFYSGPWPDMGERCGRVLPNQDCSAIQMTATELYPISNRFPEVKVGHTTQKEILSIFGAPAFSNPSLMVYVADRERETERLCGDPTETGFLRGNQVIFLFRAEKLIGITLRDNAGEC